MKNKPMTIKELKEHCNEQIKLGNGNKYIMISDDEEGNGYHYLWYAFCTIKEYEEALLDWSGGNLMQEFEWVDESIAKKENTIILG